MTMDICGVIRKFEYTAVMPKTNRCGSMLSTHAITFNSISTLPRGTTVRVTITH